MTEMRPFSVQGVAGLAALIAATATLIMPLAAALGALADRQSTLADRRKAETSLAERMARDRAEMMQDEKRYVRSLGDFNPGSVVNTLNEKCAYTAQVFLDDGLAANCSESSNTAGDGITVHTVLLTASGDASALLAVIDRIEPNQHVDQFIIEQPERQQTATLRLRYSDISFSAEESE